VGAVELFNGFVVVICSQKRIRSISSETFEALGELFFFEIDEWVLVVCFVR